MVVDHIVEASVDLGNLPLVAAHTVVANHIEVDHTVAAHIVEVVDRIGVGTAAALVADHTKVVAHTKEASVGLDNLPLVAVHIDLALVAHTDLA